MLLKATAAINCNSNPDFVLVKSDMHAPEAGYSSYLESYSISDAALKLKFHCIHDPELGNQHA